MRLKQELRRTRRPAGLLAGACLLATAAARADVADTSLGLEFSRGWSFGGAVDVGTILERRFGLTAGEADVVAIESNLDLAVSHSIHDRMQLYGELRLAHDRLLDNGAGPARQETRLELLQAYIVAHGVWPGVAVQAGRQRFEESRGWWYDEELDAVRLFVDAGPATIELSAGQSEGVDRDLLGRTRVATGNNFMAVGRFAPHEDLDLAVFLVAQDDRSTAAEKPFFIGLQSSGYIAGGIGHWIDAAVVRGSDEGQSIRAYGFDLGLEFPLPGSLPATAQLGLAFGSGDGDPLDGKNTEFRQTGLQGTYFDYGEVLAPDLSNLWIYTAGLEFEPGERTTIRFAAHYYRQDRAASTLRDTLLDRDPNGIDRDLGAALDIAGSQEVFDGAWVDLVVGAFDPGPAFGPDAKRAYFAQLLLTYEFW